MKITDQADDQLLQLLSSNVIGTPGQSMLYQHAHAAQKVKSIKDPIFCNLTIRNKLYGTITFCKRSVINCGVEYPAYYIRYFTFADKIRSTHRQSRRGRQSKIREEVGMLMDGHGLKNQDKAILYAYVDPENIRSKRLIVEFGFENVGSFHVMTYSRLQPKRSADVQKLNPTQLQSFIDQLKAFYKYHELVSFENLAGNGNYFVLKEGEEIICGVQGIPDSWKILELPGPVGKLMMKLVPHLPLIKRLFNPNYQFVFLEGLYCKAGFEGRINELLEAVLKHFKANSGILCLDPKSDIYRMVKKLNLGITHRLMGEKEVEIFAKSNGTWEKGNSDPYFVSGYDVL